MGLFYTGKGDGGQSFIGPNKIDKTSLATHTLGELDELNSIIGVAKGRISSPKTKRILHATQENLFIIQATIANIMLKSKHKPPQFPASKIKEIENIIDEYEDKLKPERGFVVSGANETSAILDYIRAISRRVERSVLVFAKKNNLKPEIKAYLNRLSSLFFALARMEAQKSRKKEKHPKYR